MTNQNDSIKKDKFYNREKLFEEVWSEPVRTVAKRYGVSDVALAKTCKKLNVPRPPVGYWSKLQFGKAPVRPELPKFENPPKILIDNPFTLNRRKMEEKPKLALDAFIEAEELVRREQEQDMEIILCEENSKLHPFVKNTQDFFKNCKEQSYLYDYGRISTIGQEVFNVQIGKQNVGRTIRILQTLCDASIKRGFSISLTSGKNPSTCFIIMGEEVGFTIFEPSTKVKTNDEERKKTYQDYKYVPQGKYGQLPTS